MKKRKTMAFLCVPGVVAALLSPALFSSAASATEAQAEVHSAVAVDDYETKAKFHENAAREMQAKVQKQKELLEHYEDKSYLYGGNAQDLQGHTHALIREYEKAVKAHLKEAALHRQKAIQLATF